MMKYITCIKKHFGKNMTLCFSVSYTDFLDCIKPLHVLHFANSNGWTGAQAKSAEIMIGRNTFVFTLDFKAIG